MNRENYIEKDIKGTSLWIQREGIFGEDYEEMILHRNPIQGLIPFYEMENMGESYLVYRIAYRRNFVQKLDGGRMNCEHMKSFIKALIYIIHMLDEYLMEPSNLILEMDHIYEEQETWSFIYVPGYQEDFWRQMEKLSEEWLNYVDYGDEKAVLWAYSFYEKVHGYGCSVEELYDITKLEKSMAYIGLDEEEVVSDVRVDYGYTEKKKKMRWWQKIKEKKSLKNRKKKEAQEEISDFFKKDNRLEDTCPMIELPQAYNQNSNKVLTLIPMGETKASVIRLDKIPVLIGRASDEVDLWFDDVNISRIHARLDYKNGQVVIVDMNSVNGTYRNGEQLKAGDSYELFAGDTIKLADMEFICQWCS